MLAATGEGKKRHTKFGYCGIPKFVKLQNRRNHWTVLRWLQKEY